MTEPKEIIEKVRIYVEGAIEISVYMKGEALMHDNTHAFISAQSSIDLGLDIQSILDGKEITSLADIRERIKKAEAEKKKGEAGTQYIY